MGGLDVETQEADEVLSSGKHIKTQVWLEDGTKNKDGETRLESMVNRKRLLRKGHCYFKGNGHGQVETFRSLVFHLLKKELLGTITMLKMEK